MKSEEPEEKDGSKGDDNSDSPREPIATRQTVDVDHLAKLIERAKNNDEHAFSEIVEVTQDRLYRFCLALSGNPQFAHDLLQDTYIRVLEKVETVKEPRSFMGWLFKTAKNTFLQYKRSPKSRENAPLEAASGREETKEAAKNDIVLEVQEVMAKLKPEERMVLVLVDVEGYSYPEAAEIIGISEAALKSRLHRARKSFIDKYEKA